MNPEEKQASLLYVETINKVLNYLSTRPWNESNELIQEITSTTTSLTEEINKRIKDLESELEELKKTKDCGCNECSTSAYLDK